jgi:type II secretory pathway pseudopilin PulG
MNRRANRVGMTLMEVVIGLAITGLMAAVGAGAFSSIIDHERQIRDASTATEQAGAMRETLRSWISGAAIQVPRGGLPRGLARGATGTAAASANRNTAFGAISAAQGSGDDITFTTSAPNPSMRANVRIRMYIDSDANTPEAGLTIEYQPSAQMPLVRKMLDSTIDSLHVEYLDQRTNRWFPSTEAATITAFAARLWMHSTDTTRSALIAVPMLFPIGNPNLSAARRATNR